MFKNTHNHIPKTHKISHVSASTWRQLFLINDNKLHKKRDKFVYDRNSTIPSTLLHSNVHIHTGNRFLAKNINRWMIGFKFGEFTWNRKLALYKAKQLKKKKK